MSVSFLSFIMPILAWNVPLLSPLFLKRSLVEIKITGRNINNLRCAGDTTLMTESDEGQRASRWGWKRRVKNVGWKLNIRKTKITASGPITSWQVEEEKVEAVRDFLFLGSKITADGDCSHKIKRRLLLGRKAMTNLDSILKSRDITLPTKDCIIKATVFPVVMYRCESWTLKKAEHQRIDASKLWCWGRLENPLDSKESSQS